MLVSVACAFGWINPLLGQMAPSPCRADKTQSACHPGCICVCVCLCSCACFSPKKKGSTGRQAVAKMVDGSVLVWEYDGSLLALPLCLCVRTCMQSCVS